MKYSVNSKMRPFTNGIDCSILAYGNAKLLTTSSLALSCSMHFWSICSYSNYFTNLKVEESLIELYLFLNECPTVNK